MPNMESNFYVFGCRVCIFAIGVVWTLTAITSVSAADRTDQKSIDEKMCGAATEVFFPDPQRKITGNVRLEHLQLQNPADPCGRTLKHDDLMHLKDQVNALAATSFSNSKSQFGVMVKYTLSPDRPAEFEMSISGAPYSEQDNLTNFYNGVKAIKPLQPVKDILYIVIQYSVAPVAN